MDYFSLEILDHFSKKTGKPLRLLEQGQGAPSPDSHMVYAYSLDQQSKPVQSHLGELVNLGFSRTLDAGPNQKEAKLNYSSNPEHQPIYVWWTQGEGQPQQAKPKSDQAANLDSTTERLIPLVPMFQTLNAKSLELLKKAMPSFLTTALGKILSDRSKATIAARRILEPIIADLGLGECAFNSKTLAKTDPELGIPEKCVPKEEGARASLKQKLLEKIQQRIFFEAAGFKQKSLADRFANASVIKVDESGKLDLQSNLDPFQSQEIVQNILEQFLKLAEKDNLDETDLHAVKTRFQYLENRDKIILYSADGRTAISLGNSGAVQLLSTWLESRYVESSGEDKDKNPNFNGFSVKKLNEDSYSSLLGDLVEDMTNLLIRSSKCKSLGLDCAKINDELGKVYGEMSVSCKILLELGSKDLIGSAEKIEEIEDFTDIIREIALREGILNPEDPKELNKIVEIAKRIGGYTSGMIREQKCVQLADWSVVTGQKRGANRKADLALFYFNEDSAKEASESTKEIYESYDINDPRLAFIFEDGKDDKNYQELKNIAIKNCAGRVPCMVHTIRPSLKTKVGKKGETTLGTTSARNTDSICALVIDNKPEKYADGFNKEHGKNLRKLEIEEAQQLRETIIARADSAGIKEAEAIEAMKKVRKYNSALVTISTLAADVETTTQDGKFVKAEGLKLGIKMFKQITKDLEISLDSLDPTEDKGAIKEVHELLTAAAKHSGRASKSEDPKTEEKLMRECLLKAAYYLQNALRRKKANQRDAGGNFTQEAMKERRALAMELLVRGGAAKNTTSVLESNFRERTSSTFIHNDAIQSHMEDLMRGDGDIKLLTDGIAISSDCSENGTGGCGDKKDKATIKISSDFSGGSAGSFVTVINGNSVERLINTGKGTETKYQKGIQRKRENSNNYNTKLSLIKEMLEQQKELLLKIISPEL